MKTFLSCLLYTDSSVIFSKTGQEVGLTVLTTLPDLSTTAMVCAIAAAMLVV